ncbi:MAG: S53 family peptidase, partial [Acidimicrobiales bacterium]
AGPGGAAGQSGTAAGRRAASRATSLGPEVAVTPAATLPAGSRVLGPVAAATRINLAIALRPRNPAALAAFVKGVSTPGSPMYRHYLPKGAFGSRFGATSAAVSSVLVAIGRVGLTGATVAPDHLSIDLSAPASRVSSALGTRLSLARLPSGRTAVANTTAAKLPASAAPAVVGVIGLDTAIRPHYLSVPHTGLSVPPTGAGGAAAHTSSAHMSSAHTAGPSACSTASSTASGQNGYTPSQLAAAYGFSSLYSGGNLGAGQTIGVYELAGFARSDVATYTSCMGVSPQISVVPTDGGATLGNGTIEATSDVEDVAGLAPAAHIIVYEAPNSGSGPYDNYSAIVNSDVAKVVTTSWGSCESSLPPSYIQAESNLFAQAASQGQTVLAASGDTGSEDCYSGPGTGTQLAVDDPGSQPYVVSVGGTSLDAAGPPPVQTAWNDGPPTAANAPSTGPGAGGGGVSSVWPMPSWQSGPGVVSSYSSGTPCGAPGGQYCRQVPDVSASANPYHGYTIYCTQGDCPTNGVNGWTTIGGTSLAAPLWAALIALSNEACPSQPPAGFVTPALYKLAASGGSAGDPFTDIVPSTTGPNNNDYTGTNGVDYPVTTGYDMATGLGSPIGGRLAADLCPATGSTSSSGPGSAAPTGKPTPPPTTSPSRATGYWEVASDGGLFSFGTAGYFGSTGGRPIAGPIVAMAATSDHQGYWLAGSNGSVHAFGNAGFYGSLTSSGVKVSDIVGIAPTPDGKGYWLVGSDGGIFAFGTASFYGSMGGKPLNKPIVGIAATPGGHGYWEVATDGGIFAFGDASFYGSMGGKPLNKPIVGIAATPGGHGYWEVATDGGIFTFGTASFYGSMGGKPLNKPIVGMAPA